MNEVVITISIKLPDGVTPDVSYGSPQPQQTQASPVVPPPGGAWVCPEHGSRKVVPAGTSKKTGKAYKSFVACAESGCDQKPPWGPGPDDSPPARTEPEGQFDDLPF
jgi:hypothetical protein